MSFDYLHDAHRQVAAQIASLIAGHQMKWVKAIAEVKAETGIRPDDTLIASEIRRWYACFDHEAHQATLRRKRESALTVMQALREWHPTLIGHVLSGAATDDTAIEILIQIEDEKGVELTLLSLGISYDTLDIEAHGRQSRISLLTECQGENVILVITNASNSVKSALPDEWQHPLEARAKLDEKGLLTLLRED